MLSKIYYPIVALCVLLLTATAIAQSTHDSTNLTKMTEGGYTAVDNAVPLNVLTQGNLLKTFNKMRLTLDNVGAYSKYSGDLHYRIKTNYSGDPLRVLRYTPSRHCTRRMNRPGRELCNQENEKYKNKTSVMCTIPKGATSCTSSNGSYYELAVNGLLMGESYATCWQELVPIANSMSRCGFKQLPRRIYLWDAQRAS